MKSLFIALGLSISIYTAAHAQIIVTEEINDAIQRAVKKDIEVNNQQLELSKMDLERRSVLSKYIPKVEAKAVYAHFNSDMALDIPTQTVTLPSIPGGSSPAPSFHLFEGEQNVESYGSFFHGGVTAKAVLFSGGQIYHGAKALEQKNAGTSLMMEGRKDQVVESIIKGYDQIQLLKSAEKLIDESERRLIKESERVEKAIAAGLAIPYDREKIRLSTLELTSKRRDVQHKQKLVALKIAQETGINEDIVLNTYYPLDPILIGTSLSAADRNEIRALEHFKKASAYNVKKEKGSYLPTLGAFGGYGYTSLFNTNAQIPLPALNQTAQLGLNHFTINPTWTVGLGMKWEIFSGFERKHQVKRAELGLLQIENQLADVREKLDLQLHKNQVEYENALDQVDIATQRERIAQNNNTLAEKQYKAGLITITERLATENELYEVALKRVEAIAIQRQSALETFRSSGSLLSFITVL